MATIRVRIRFSVLLVSGYAHVFVLVSIVIVTRRLELQATLSHVYLAK